MSQRGGMDLSRVGKTQAFAAVLTLSVVALWYEIDRYHRPASALLVERSWVDGRGRGAAMEPPHGGGSGSSMEATRDSGGGVEAEPHGAPVSNAQAELEQHIIGEHVLEEVHKDSELTLEELHDGIAEHLEAGGEGGADSEAEVPPPGPVLPAAHASVRHSAGGRRAGRHSQHGHHWAAYKGPLLESKQADTNSEFYTKYVHSTIEKKLAYPIIKGFWQGVLDHYPAAQTWFDGGAGTCGIMEAAIKAGKSIRGVELSDVSQTTCRPLYQQGLVAQGPLHRIDEPDSAFDLVFSSEVLEHVPPNLANASVRELVRIAKRDVFTTISLRPSALDRPGRPPKVHLTVRPREWWERLFEEAGCVRNEEAYRKFQQFDKKGKPVSPHFFIYVCDKSQPSAAAAAAHGESPWQRHETMRM
mmetsp:Transcript_23052/g.57909  ORF Transcript_23052/g.57909 Transcript_23052/m.57909 type:complete len:415 (+) Transcript_23052:279-1523(+)|eukprot:jgi/Tetstr1/446175/TSEL_003576.t1